MSRTLLALAIGASLALTLGACSSGGSDDDDSGTNAPTDGGAPGTGEGDGDGSGEEDGGVPSGIDPNAPPAAPGGAGAPDGTTVANTYVGDFGAGPGVYVVDQQGELSGLSLNADGSATSLFGNLGIGADTFSGTLRQQTHDASRPVSAGVFGTGRSDLVAAGPFTLNIVPGQGIESTAGPQVNLSVETAELMPATVQSVAGTWSAENRYTECDGSAACTLMTEVTFNGERITGQTSLGYGDGDARAPVFVQPIDGTVAEYGDVLLVQFDWGTTQQGARYDGIVYFADDGSGRLVLLGEQPAADGDLPTIASLLSRN